LKEIVLELLQDPSAKDHIDFHPRPLYESTGTSTKRLFGPFSSGLWWQNVQIKRGNKVTIACLIFYSDGTQFYKNGGAYPILGNFFRFSVLSSHCSLFCMIGFLVVTLLVLWDMAKMIFVSMCSYTWKLQGGIQVFPQGLEISWNDAKSCQSQRKLQRDGRPI